jgi:hypothetical protein
MILSLIDSSKYKAQEANFKFWDELKVVHVIQGISCLFPAKIRTGVF